MCYIQFGATFGNRKSGVNRVNHVNSLIMETPIFNTTPEEIAYWNKQMDWLSVKQEKSTNPLKEKFANASEADKLKMLGIKSGKAAKIYTEAEDKAKRANRFAEDNIVNAWAKWFKATYPNIPYTIDKVAQRRSHLGGVIHKAHAYQSGNPDIFIQCAKGCYHGLYIEQKKDDNIFYKGTKILKPGSDCHLIWQSLYHADLRKQGYWVMFSISLEASQKITQRYMSGNPYQQQVFPYYCKPEDYAMFGGTKHFKPVKERP